MAATIQSLAADVKCNKLSLIGPLTEDDVLMVWEKVAQFVETLMLQQKVRNHVFYCTLITKPIVICRHLKSRIISMSS